MTKKEIENIAFLLEMNYDYYDTVAFGFIVEAIENSIKDGINPNNIKALHKHITQNYI